MEAKRKSVQVPPFRKWFWCGMMLGVVGGTPFREILVVLERGTDYFHTFSTYNWGLY
jgi:hypothetical protein